MEYPGKKKARVAVIGHDDKSKEVAERLMSHNKDFGTYSHAVQSQ
jgi:hypothetical protein